MGSLISTFVSTLLIALLIGYLNKKSKTKIIPLKNGTYNLRLHKLYWFLGLVSVILGIAGFILATVLVKDGNGWIFGVFFLLLFGGLGMVCVLWYVNHKFSFDTNKIRVTNVYGKSQVMHWSDVKIIDFKKVSSLLVFENFRGEKVKAHQHLVGFSELLQMIENKTRWKIKDLKLPEGFEI